MGGWRMTETPVERLAHYNEADEAQHQEMLARIAPWFHARPRPRCGRDRSQEGRRAAAHDARL